MKVALITGGSRGLGRSMALHLGSQGRDVILTYKSAIGEADTVVRQIEAMGRKAASLKLDVSDVSTFDTFVSAVKAVLAQKWQRKDFDFLINNAGIGTRAPFTETSEAQFDEMVNIHLKGPFFLTQKLVPLMGDGARILNVSSG